MNALRQSGLAAALATFGISSAHSQPDVPSIQVLETKRSVTALVRADESDDASDVERETTETAGPFVASVFESASGNLGSSGSASASQNTHFATFSLSGQGQAESIGNLAGGDQAYIDVYGASEASLRFSVPVDAPWSLTGAFTGGGFGVGNVGIAGRSPDSVYFYAEGFNRDTPLNERSFFFSDTAAAGVDQNFGISVVAPTFGDREIGTSNLADSAGSFEFVLHFGDRDGDGLLDDWEENGIDFDGQAPPEIDLPAMGADPDVKDLFVEVDVMAGVPYDQAAIDRVVQAFARAPAAAVNNPNGARGIRLHVIIDGDRPAHESLQGPGGRLPSRFYEIKKDFFGSAEDRSHPSWGAIRDAKLAIFRYCLWADTLVLTYPPPLGEAPFLGGSEGAPSNDFVLAAGDLVGSYDDRVTDRLAGMFMHEFGHTLGLLHGGGDEINFKPNYLSVMNYAYTMPYEVLSVQGTDLSRYWRLDFSRTQMPSLNETRLDELQGPGSPPGRVIYFNSADASDDPPVQRTAALGYDWQIDWNANASTIEPPYRLDLSRPDPTAELNYDTNLRSYSDWDRIVYGVAQLVDDLDESIPKSARSSPGVLMEEIDAFHQVEWIDLVPSRDSIFEDTFD